MAIKFATGLAAVQTEAGDGLIIRRHYSMAPIMFNEKREPTTKVGFRINYFLVL